MSSMLLSPVQFHCPKCAEDGVAFACQHTRSSVVEDSVISGRKALASDWTCPRCYRMFTSFLPYVERF